MVQGAPHSWRRVTTPLSLAVVALLAAIALWVAVSEAENPSRVDFFSGAVEITPANVPEGLAVASLSSPTVTLRVRADEDTFSRLSAADFRALVDMAGERQGVSEKRVIVESLRDGVDVVDVTPASVTVNLEQSLSKQLPVQPNLVGSPAQGFSVPAGGVESTPASVRVTGATSLVQLASVATANVNLTGLRVSLQQQFSLIARDARGVDLRGLFLEPANAVIKVSIVQQEVTLGLTVVPQVGGEVADGYYLVSAVAEPVFIPVSGPLELLQAVAYVTTEPVEIGGLRADATRTARLRLPPGVQTTRDSVTVRLKVAPALGEINIAVAPQVVNVAEGLRASLQTSSVSVRLGGDQPTLRALQPGAVRATVNATGLAEGVHVLQPTIVYPQALQLLSTDPTQVVLVLSR